MPPRKTFEQVVLQKLRSLDEVSMILAEIDVEVLTFSAALDKRDYDATTAAVQNMKDLHKKLRAEIHAGWEGWGDDDTSV